MGKNVLNEVKSLIQRIENPPTINEVTCKWRDVAGDEVFMDVLGGLKPGSFVTFGYVSNAKIEVPKGKRLNPQTNRMNQFDDYAALGKNLGEETEVINVIKLTIYNMPHQKQGYDSSKYDSEGPFFDAEKSWRDQESVPERYSAWKHQRDELAKKYGVEYGKARYQKQNINYGGGISAYAGNNKDISDHSYLNFNMDGVMPISTKYYLLFNDGGIKEVDKEKLTVLPYTSSDALKKLRDAGATPEELADLEGMDYRTFENSQVLFISATPDDGIPVLMINNRLSEKITGLCGVGRDAIVQLCKDRYSKFVDKDVEFI